MDNACFLHLKRAAAGRRNLCERKAVRAQEELQRKKTAASLSANKSDGDVYWAISRMISASAWNARLPFPGRILTKEARITSLAY